MRELQDQLEAEQYFSVSNSVIFFQSEDTFFHVSLHWSCIHFIIQTLFHFILDSLQNSGEGVERRSWGEKSADPRYSKKSSRALFWKVRFIFLLRLNFVLRHWSAHEFDDCQYPSVPSFVSLGSRSLLSWTSPWQRQSRSSWPERCRRSSISSSLRRTKKLHPDTNRKFQIKTRSSHGSVAHIPDVFNSSKSKIMFLVLCDSDLFFLQLEESNKTLTKDVEILSKEKTELNERLRDQEEGNFISLWLP